VLAGVVPGKWREAIAPSQEKGNDQFCVSVTDVTQARYHHHREHGLRKVGQ